jgi:ATP-binding cassette, subfamily G (WHITE), member 2, PDR
MFDVIGAAPGAVANRDYAQAWRESTELQGIKMQLQRMRENPKPLVHNRSHENSKYAASFPVQLYYVTYRCFQQLYRTPSYIVSDVPAHIDIGDVLKLICCTEFVQYSKFLLLAGSNLLIGFAFFKSPNTMQV